MWVIEVWRTTSYGSTYHGYYREESHDRFCTDINCATKFDKAEVDTIQSEGVPINISGGWSCRLKKYSQCKITLQASEL